jgi:hypothetical protein
MHLIMYWVVRSKEQVQEALEATAHRRQLEAEARKVAEASAETTTLEGQGPLDERSPDPGMGLLHDGSGMVSQLSKEEGSDRELEQLEGEPEKGGTVGCASHY